MRIISQDNNLDFPYENIAISIGFRGDKKEFYVFAHMINCYEMGKMPQKLATYSTEAKAKKAIEMLRETYQYGKKIPVPKLDESGIDKEDNITLYNTRLINDFFKGGTYVPVKVFQFPRDEDVEV